MGDAALPISLPEVVSPHADQCRDTDTGLSPAFGQGARGGILGRDDGRPVAP